MTPEAHPKWIECRLSSGLTIDRDHNAAVNIKFLAVGHAVNKAQVTSDALAGVTEQPTRYASA
jgi:putative transposase